MQISNSTVFNQSSNNVVLPINPTEDFMKAFESFKTLLSQSICELHTKESLTLHHQKLSELSCNLLDLLEKHPQVSREITENAQEAVVKLELAIVVVEIKLSILISKIKNTKPDFKQLEALLANAWESLSEYEIPSTLLNDTLTTCKLFDNQIGCGILSERIKFHILKRLFEENLGQLPTIVEEDEYKGAPKVTPSVKPNSLNFLELYKKIQNLNTEPQELLLEKLLEYTTALYNNLSNIHFPFQINDFSNHKKIIKAFITKSFYLDAAHQKMLIKNNKYIELLEYSFALFSDEINEKLHDTTLTPTFTIQELKNYLNLSIIYFKIINRHHQPSFAFHVVALLQLQFITYNINEFITFYALQNPTDPTGQKLFKFKNAITFTIKELLHRCKKQIQSYNVQETHLVQIITGEEELLSQQDILKLIETCRSNLPQFISKYLNEITTTCNTLSPHKLTRRGFAFIFYLLSEINTKEKQEKLKLNDTDLDYLEKSIEFILTILLNLKNDPKIYSQLEACKSHFLSLEIKLSHAITSKDLINIKTELKKVYKIQKDSIGQLKTPLGCLSETRAFFFKTEKLYRRLIGLLNEKLFLITTEKAINTNLAFHTQFSLPGLNLFGQLVEPSSKILGASSNACGTISAYATYFGLMQIEAAAQEKLYKEPSLKQIMRLGTSRYQTLLRHYDITPKLTMLKEIFEEDSEVFLLHKRDLITSWNDKLRCLHPSEIFSQAGFANLLKQSNNILSTQITENEHLQYTNLLESLTQHILRNKYNPLIGQVGAIFCKANDFYSLVIKRVQKQHLEYTITFTDSHGSSNPQHDDFFKRAFKIIFSSVEDAGNFLSLYIPYYKDTNPESEQQLNKVTLYPVRLTKQTRESQMKLSQDNRNAKKTAMIPLQELLLPPSKKISNLLKLTKNIPDDQKTASLR